MTWTTLPTLSPFLFFTWSTIVLLLQGFGTADELGDFLGNGRLANAISLQGQVLDHFLGVLGRRAHSHHPRRVLGGERLEHGGHHARQRVTRQEGGKDLRRR